MIRRKPITIATWDYDRVRAIIDGRVDVEGCDVTYLPLAPEECLHRTYLHREFEVAEIGFSPYLISLSRGTNDYVALPIFLSRMFRHSAIYIRTDRGINGPADLRGRRVGVPDERAVHPKHDDLARPRIPADTHLGVQPGRATGVAPGQHDDAAGMLPAGVVGGLDRPLGDPVLRDDDQRQHASQGHRPAGLTQVDDGLADRLGACRRQVDDHGRLQVRPSRAIIASAPAGPQLPPG